MKICVLSGSSQSGKTNTLHTLALLLNSMPSKYVFNAASSDALPTALPVSYDGQYLFEEAATGRKIGISTGGDTEEVIDSAFNFFSQSSCDIGFVASKSYGATVDQIEVRANNIGVVPQYLLLIWSKAVRGKSQIQNDIASQLEMMI